MLQQFVLNGLIAGSVYAFIALSFLLIYSVARFFHFAHGAVGAVGAYACYWLRVSLGVPLWAAVPAAVLVSGLLGVGMELTVYGRLRKQGASPLVLLLASLGLYLVVENVLAMLFGTETRVLRAGAASAVSVLGARMTTVQVGAAAACLLIFLAAWFVLRFTRIGRTHRAVADDGELAMIVGVQSDAAIIGSFFFGSAIAGIACIFVALDVDMRPTMGLSLLLPGVVAMVIGGSRSVTGTLAGGFALGLLQHLGVWVAGAQWQDAIVFVILVLFLVFHRWGVLNVQSRRTTG